MTKTKTAKETYIGIDVAMEWLDVALHPQGKSFRFANSVAGIADLAAALASFEIAKIVLEATGGLEYAAAAYLKMTEKTLYRLAGGGAVPGFKVGGSWRFRKSGIDRWIKGQEKSGKKADSVMAGFIFRPDALLKYTVFKYLYALHGNA